MSSALNPLYRFFLITAFSVISVLNAGAQTLQLDGVNDRVDVPSSATLSITGPLSVEAWVNRAVSGVQHSVVEKYGCGGLGGYVLRINAADKVLFGVRDDCSGGPSVIGATSIPAGVWTHIAGVWDGTTLRVFVNGVADGTLANTRPPRAGTTPLRIGARGNDFGTPFNGRIDEVRVWGVGRTGADIAANRTVCLTGSEAGLRAYYRLDAGAGTTAADSSPNGNTGTLLNGTGWNPANAFTCGAPPPPPPPGGGAPLFEALEIFPPAGPLVVPPPLFPGAVADTTPLPTNGFVGTLPTGTICLVVIPGSPITEINTAPNGGQEIVVDIGGQLVRTYTSSLTTIRDPISVGTIVRIIGNRTLAPGPIVAEVIGQRPVEVGGMELLFLYQGIISRAEPTVWTVGGIDFTITGLPLPTAIDILAPQLGVDEATVEFTLAGGQVVIPPPPPGSAFYDALEIFPPVGPLTVPASLFPGAIADTRPVPTSILPPGTIALVVIPGGTITGIRTSGLGREWTIDIGGEIVRVYNSSTTEVRDNPVVGSVVRVVANRTLAPGPIIAEVIRGRPTPVPGVEFLFLNQGIVTQADSDIWTIGGIRYNLLGLPTPTAIDILAPVLGVTEVTVEFSPILGLAEQGPPTLTVVATDADASEAGADGGSFTITRTGIPIQPLTVSVAMSGTALNGTDYAAIPASIVMPSGSNSVVVNLTVSDDGLAEGTESAVMTLNPSPSYILGAPSSATVSIADDEPAPPTVSIAAGDSAASETGPDTATFTVTRSGSTAAPLTVNYTISGSAGNGVDYGSLGTSVVIPGGSPTADIVVTPIDDSSFEGAETVALTLAANAAYVIGSPSFASASIADNDPAPADSAVQLNGTTSYVEVPDSASLRIVTPFTVEAWVNRAASGVQHSVVEKYGCSGLGGYVLRIGADNRVMFGVRNDCNGGANVISAATVPAGTWTHIAGVWDGANLRVFINGVQSAVVASTLAPRLGTTPLRIGARGNDVGTKFNGVIDEVRIWNVARTAAQISASRSICLSVPQTGLVGYWRFNEASGLTANDLTSNANHGALTGSPVRVVSTVPITCP